MVIPIDPQAQRRARKILSNRRGRKSLCPLPLNWQELKGHFLIQNYFLKFLNETEVFVPLTKYTAALVIPEPFERMGLSRLPY